MGSWGDAPSGDSKERVTRWSGCIGLKVLAGSRAEPSWDGAKPSPSGEPTTTEAKRVVIVGYNKASLVVFPANPFACAYFFIPPSIRSISDNFRPL